MRTEHSAGAVLYTVVNGEPRYVVVTERSGYASLPKGHLEEGETPAQAALREIREETGITAPLTTAEPLWQDGYALRDARTGEAFFGEYYEGDLGRCMIGDVTDGRGLEVWAMQMRNVKGEFLDVFATMPPH